MYVYVPIVCFLYTEINVFVFIAGTGQPWGTSWHPSSTVCAQLPVSCSCSSSSLSSSPSLACRCLVASSTSTQPRQSRATTLTPSGSRCWLSFRWVCHRVGVSQGRCVTGWVCHRVGVSQGGCVTGWVCHRVGVSQGGCVTGCVCHRVGVSQGGCVTGWMCHRFVLTSVEDSRVGVGAGGRRGLRLVGVVY